VGEVYLIASVIRLALNLRYLLLLVDLKCPDAIVNMMKLIKSQISSKGMSNGLKEISKGNTNNLTEHEL
jgi:hypothetical protein